MDNNILNIVKSVDGWLTDSEIKTLYRIASAQKDNSIIVEIGSFKGKSTVCLGLAIKTKRNVKIIAIDPHISDLEQKKWLNGKSSYDEFKSNIDKNGVNDIVEPIVKKSEDANKNWSKSIDFLWIDGDHTYDGAKKDFDLYSPFVKENGVIAFHDATMGDLPKLVVECFSRSEYTKIHIVDSIVFAEKTIAKKKSVKDKVNISILRNYQKVRGLIAVGFIRKIFKKILSRI